MARKLLVYEAGTPEVFRVSLRHGLLVAWRHLRLVKSPRLYEAIDLLSCDFVVILLMTLIK